MSDLENLLRGTAGPAAEFAQVSPQGPRHSRSWRQVDEDARRAAAGLARLGVGSGDRVAIAMQTTPEAVTALFGIWRAGATAVSIPTPTRKGAASYRQAFRPVLDRLGVRVVVGTGAIEEVLASHTVVAPQSLGGDALLPTDLPVPAEALVQFTSGSTGAPRGVSVSRDALVAQLLALRDHLELAPGERLACWLPLSHDMGLIGFLLAAVASGAATTLMPPVAFARNPRIWARLLADEGATVTAGPDFGFRVAARVAAGDHDTRSLAAVRAWICGGERIHPATLSAFHAAFEPRGVRWESLVPAYGMAESVLATSLTDLGRGPRIVGEHVALGRPLPVVEVRATHETGPLAVRGPSTFDGYHRGDGVDRRDRSDWFVTQDAGHLDEHGEVVVVGRLDEVVIVRGTNVYAEDLEHVVLSSGLPVLTVAALRAPGSTDRFDVVAASDAVSDRDGGPLLAKQLRALLDQATPAPVDRVHLVAPRDVPRTTSGKAQRQRCRALIEQGWPGPVYLA